MDIVNNRTNANKLLARLLFDLREKVPLPYFIWKGVIRIMLYPVRHLLNCL